MRDKLKQVKALLAAGQWEVLAQGITKRWSSTNLAFGLKRDLLQPFEPPKARIAIAIKPYQPEFDPFFREDHSNAGLSTSGIRQGFMAVDESGTPCYRQWLMNWHYNPDIQRFWGGAFPVLNPGEALMESAFTPSAGRGKGIMSEAMCKIALKGLDDGVKEVITFVEVNNTASLKGCARAGFEPYILREEKWKRFKRTVHFRKIPDSLWEKYQSEVLAVKV